MKGGNSDSMSSEIQGFDYDGVDQYGLVDMTGGKKKKSKSKSNSTKFSNFDFAKEWKEFEESYNQKYGGTPKKKKSSSSTKKNQLKRHLLLLRRNQLRKALRSLRVKLREVVMNQEQLLRLRIFDANATMSSSSNDQSKGSLVDGLYPHSPNNATVDMTGGSKKKASKAKKSKTATKTTKPKKDSKKDTKKKDSKKDSKKDTKSTGKKVSVLDKIKKFFAM